MPKQFIARAGLVILLVTIGTLSISAQWFHNPNVSTAVSTATGNQDNSKIVSDGSGGAIIVWQDDRNPSADDIYAQRLNSGGSIQWTANGVPICLSIGGQDDPSIVADGSGGAIIAWIDHRNSDFDIYAQRVNSSGVVQWTTNGVAVCTAVHDQLDPTIASDDSGGAIITWRDFRNNSNYDIYAQRIDAAGAVQWTPDGIAICTATGHQVNPSIVSDDSGGAIISWGDSRGVASDVYAQRVNSLGSVVWAANGVAVSAASSDQYGPMITRDGAHGAIVAWLDRRNGGNTDIYAGRIDAAGSVLWTSNGVALCTAASDQNDLQITSDSRGGAIAAWTDARTDAGDVYAQRVDSAGTVIWNPNGVSVSSTTNDQTVPSLVSDDAGGALIAWKDRRVHLYDIYAQRIDASGTPVWTPNGIPISSDGSLNLDAKICGDGNGGAIIEWDRGNTPDVYASKLDANGVLGGSMVRSILPAQNALNISQSANISVTFDASMNTSTLSSSNILVYGSQSGKHAGTITISGDTACTFNPTVDFKPGERIMVSLSRNILDAAGDSLINGYHWSCTVGVSGGDGIFSEPVTVGVGSFPIGVATADFDANGITDIVVTDYLSDSISVLLQNPVGTFSRTDIRVGTQPRIIVSGDFDGNGTADLAVVNSQSNSVSILTNNGSAAFAYDTLSVAGTPSGLTAGDWDGDGDIDLAVTENSLDSVAILLNDGTAHFIVASTVAVGDHPSAIVSGDFNNDGVLDLAVGNYLAGSVSILLNSGNGSFTNTSTINIGFDVYALNAGDWDGDGDLDLVTTSYDSNKVAILTNNGLGTFLKTSASAVGSQATETAAGDFDHDGDLDLASANSGPDNVSILKNNGGGVFLTGLSFPVGAGPNFVTSVDIDNDGDLDLITADANAQSITILSNHVLNSISGTVYNDTNGNGVIEVGDTGLVNWKILLKSPTGTIVDSALTDAEGNYLFLDAPNGSYVLSEVQQDSLIQTYPLGSGTYAVTVSNGSANIEKDFGNVSGYRYTGPTSGVWSNPANWLGLHTPYPENKVLIPRDVVVDALPGDSIQVLRVKDSSLTFSTAVKRLKIAGIVRNDRTASLNFAPSNDSTGLICYSDLVNDGSMNPGKSTVTMAGNRSKTIVSNSSNTRFFDLEIAGDNTNLNGSIAIKNRLLLRKPFSLTNRDTILIDTSAVNAIQDTGRIPRGSIRRLIAPGETNPYRFESQNTSIAFGTGGTVPTSVTITTLPDTTPPSFELKWVVVGGTSDSANHTVTADSIGQFSKWAIGIVRPNGLGQPIIPRLYVIKTEGGSNFLSELRLRYDVAEIPPLTSESSLKLLRGPCIAGIVLNSWNMVSLPLVPDDSGKSVLFPSSTSNAFGFDGGYVPRTNLRHGEGFWLRFSSSQSVSIIGDDRENDTIPVNTGWNMIGTLSFPIPVSGVSSIPPGIIVSSVFGYTGSYTLADSLLPLKGYWVKTSSPGEIVLKYTPELSAQTKSGSEVLHQLNTLTVSTADGNVQELFFGGQRQTIELKKFELPPLPPAGAFDARFAPNTLVELSDEKKQKEIPLLISSASYPLQLSWKIADHSTDAALIVGNREIVIRRNGTVSIDTPNTPIVLRLSAGHGESLPREYALGQNYPNPFNPVTVIRYQIPDVERSGTSLHRVRLVVYNLLGQEVITLVDEMEDAGYKSVEWDASTFSSGVYFYKMEATDVDDSRRSFSDVRKMVVIR